MRLGNRVMMKGKLCLRIKGISQSLSKTSNFVEVCNLMVYNFFIKI